MSSSACLPEFHFLNSYASLPHSFYESVEPTAVNEATLFAFNDELAVELGLDPSQLNNQTGAHIFAGNTIPAGATPLAMAYAGHQFGHFVPRLGDGRAVLLGELKNKHGQLQDIQLKGAGRTPFSRGGDGRAWIGPVMREYLISEAMHKLGVPTTRALAAVTTGESILREQGPVPGAVLTRVADSHLRVGTFEYFASQQDNESLAALVDYAIERHYSNSDNDTGISSEDPAALYLLKRVIAQQARLIAQWQSFGFIHGVMNTDNASVAGITIDYGPCAFMDIYAEQKVFSSIDQRARYSYKNQPHIGQWNMASLAQTLIPLLDEDENKAVEMAQAAVDDYPKLFTNAYLDRFQRKLGIFASNPEAQDADHSGDLQLINDLLSLMEVHECDFTLTFRELSKFDQSAMPDNSFTALFSDLNAAQAWFARWQERLERNWQDPSDNISSSPGSLMQQSNPAFIARNHRVEEAITAAVSENNFEPFETLHSVLKNPFDEQAQHAELKNAPTLENTVTATFCGT